MIGSPLLIKLSRWSPFERLNPQNNEGYRESKAVRAAEAYFREHANERANTQELCVLTGVSVRTLQVGFKDTLLRLQYEYVVRALWIGYVAKESQIEKSSTELTEDSARRASNNMVTIKDMLDELETAGKAGKAPMQPVEELKEFKDSQMKPLNSFVHSGVHAIQRQQMGYPIPLVVGVLKSSNGLLLMAAMLIVNLSENHSYRGKLLKVCHAFSDCLPPPREGL